MQIIKPINLITPNELKKTELIKKYVVQRYNQIYFHLHLILWIDLLPPF